MVDEVKSQQKNGLRRLAYRCFIYALTLLFVVGFGLYISRNRSLFAELLHIRIGEIALLFGLWMLLTIPQGLIKRMIANRLGYRLGFVDWYGLSTVTNMMSLILPSRGDFIVSSVYLKVRYRFSVSHFMSMIYGNSVLMAIVLTTEAALAMLALGVTGGVWSLKILYATVAMGIAATALILLPGRLLKFKRLPIPAFLKNAIEGWEKIRSDSALLIKLSSVIIIGSCVFTAWMFFSYYILDFPVSVLGAIMVGIVCQMSFFFALTPGNLGIREAAVGLVSEVTGFGFAQGVAVTLLQRAISTTGFLIVGGAFSIPILRRFTKVTSKPLREQQHE